MNERMKKLLIWIFIIFGCGFFLSSSPVETESEEKGMSIEYTVEVREEEIDHFHVIAHISPLIDDRIVLAMTSNYGRQKKLEDLIPDVSFEKIPQSQYSIRKINEFLWDIIVPDQRTLVVDYSVKNQFRYSSLNMVRLPNRDGGHLYFPASSVFIYPDEEFLLKNKIKIKKIKINFILPKNWIAVTSWGSKHASIDIDPPSLDSLNEGLIGLGAYRVYFLNLLGFPAEISTFNSSEDVDEKIQRAVEKAFRSGSNLFGFFPLPKFFGLIHFIRDSPGHIKNGNSLGWSINLNFSMPMNHPHWISQESHLFSEIFHFWNGTDGPPLSRPQDDHSTIWFTEGITDFYRLKLMMASGLLNPSEYLDLLSEEYNRIIQSPRLKDDLDMISRDYYSDPEAMALTYSKGCCLAFAVDVLLRRISSGQKSLDDIMRRMLDRYDYRKRGHGYSHRELDNTFRDFLGEKYFSSYKKLYGKDFLAEFKAILEMMGFSLEEKKGTRLFFGIIDFGPPSGPPIAFRLDKKSPAFKAGLREGDILLEVNEYPVREPSDVKVCLRRKKEDAVVDLIVERNGQKISLRTVWSSFETRFEIKKSLPNQD